MSSPTRNSCPRLEVASVGRRASDALTAATSGSVLAVFDRSIHLAAGDRIVCVGDSSIGAGPFNALIEPPGVADWTSAFTPAEPLSISSCVVCLPRCVIDFSAASPWRPRPWPKPKSIADISAAMETVADLARNRAPLDGLARLILLGETASHASPARALCRIATPRIAALASWLEEALTRDTCPEFPADALGLIGAGPGLTPSGDDVVCGALLAMHAVGKPDVARSAACALLPAARDATTQLSRVFLEAAAEGEASEALHDFTAAIMSGSHADIGSAVEALGDVGHTSGWDALAGAFLVLSAYAGSCRSQKSP